METNVHGSYWLGGKEETTYQSQAATHTHEPEPPLGGNWF